MLRLQFGYDIRRNEEEIRIVHASEEELAAACGRGCGNPDEHGTDVFDSVKPFEYFQIVAIPSFFKFRSVTTV
ncbi:MAG: hypothetical protein ACLSA6_01965 [Holdemania massiliensis]